MPGSQPRHMSYAGQLSSSALRTIFVQMTRPPTDQALRLSWWAILDLNQRPFPYQRNALAD